MYKKITFITLIVVLLSGCASVPMAQKEDSNKAKMFNTPDKGKAGIYVYRGLGLGTLLKKDIWIDGECIGETAPSMFFYKQVKGNEDHIVVTESEALPMDLLVQTESGKNYFVKQFIIQGTLYGAAILELINEDEGKQAVSELELAEMGVCDEGYNY